jgi:DNA-binding beta-propeller fold protein YncE
MNFVKARLAVIAMFFGVLLALGVASSMLEKKAAVQAAGLQAPRFEVDPLWPKPLPNHWLLGMTIGVSVDSQDHVWIIHRQASLDPKEAYMISNPPSSDCCQPAPPVLAFDQAGNLIAHWGGKGPGYDWPNSNHGITVDYKGNVWIGGNGTNDAQILEFTQDGKLIKQIGKPGVWGSNNMENFGRPAKTFFDKDANEVYVSDGYGNRRVVVMDADTGKFKRYWGAYGNKPDDTDLGPYNPAAPVAKQFRTPVHCAELANDGLVYVCDRVNDRIQVFQKDGTFVKETIIEKNTLGDGAVWDIAFSKDPKQTYIYLADGSNEKIHILLRDSLQELTTFGDGGRQPGEFYAVHSIATDSKGNIYTTETYHGQRVQKFVYKGLAPVTTKEEGVVWPKAGK